MHLFSFVTCAILVAISARDALAQITHIQEVPTAYFAIAKGSPTPITYIMPMPMQKLAVRQEDGYDYGNAVPSGSPSGAHDYDPLGNGEALSGEARPTGSGRPEGHLFAGGVVGEEDCVKGKGKGRNKHSGSGEDHKPPPAKSKTPRPPADNPPGDNPPLDNTDTPIDDSPSTPQFSPLSTPAQQAVVGSKTPVAAASSKPPVSDSIPYSVTEGDAGSGAFKNAANGLLLIGGAFFLL